MIADGNIERGSSEGHGFHKHEPLNWFRFGLGGGFRDFRQFLRRVAGPAWTHVNFEPHEPVLKGSFSQSIKQFPVLH